jgi:hypothetical protein
MPVHWLFRPVSIAVATWSLREDGSDKTAETSSHFVDALGCSTVHPVNMKANSRAITLIRFIPVNELAMDFPFPPDGDRRAGAIQEVDDFASRLWRKLS